MKKQRPNFRVVSTQQNGRKKNYINIGFVLRDPFYVKRHIGEEETERHDSTFTELFNVNCRLLHAAALRGHQQVLMFHNNTEKIVY